MIFTTHQLPGGIVRMEADLGMLERLRSALVEVPRNDPLLNDMLWMISTAIATHPSTTKKENDQCLDA